MKRRAFFKNLAKLGIAIGISSIKLPAVEKEPEKPVRVEYVPHYFTTHYASATAQACPGFMSEYQENMIKSCHAISNQIERSIFSEVQRLPRS